MRSYVQSLNGMERALPPENEYLYRTKPLPPPPIPPKDTSRSKRSLAAAQKTSHGREGSVRPSQRPLPPVLPPSPSQQYAGRMSLPASPSITTITGRHSSQKVHQLTGHDVASSDYLPLRRIHFPSASPTDSSSSYSQSLDCPIFEEESTLRYSESSAPPPLDSDCDGMSSKRSSGAPKSPQCVQFSMPPPRKPSLSHYHTAPGGLDHPAGLQVSFLDESPWRGSKSYHYFTDNETADEYHRIATDLAAPPARSSLYNKSPQLTHAHSSFSSRLSFSAKALFARRREPPTPVDSNRASFASGHQAPRTPYPPLVHPLSIESHLASPPRSVFETDEDEENESDSFKLRGTIKGYLARRSEDQLSTEPIVPRSPPSSQPARPETPSVLAKTGGQVKELFSGAKNGVKSLQASRAESRAEKRRNQLRSQIRVIPEASTSNHYI